LRSFSFAHVGRRRGVRGELGQTPTWAKRLRPLAPWAKLRPTGRSSSIPLGGPGGPEERRKDAKGNYGFVYHRYQRRELIELTGNRQNGLIPSKTPSTWSEATTISHSLKFHLDLQLRWTRHLLCDTKYNDLNGRDDYKLPGPERNSVATQDRENKIVRGTADDRA